MQNTSKSRTFTATVNHRLEGILMDTATHTITMSRSAGQYSATVDGKAVDVHTAARLLTWADTDGVLTILETCEGISTREASALHRTLARWGVQAGNQKALASAAVGRVITSFTELAQAEISIVTRHASQLMAGVA